MACACKVDKQITLIEKQYGTKVLPTKKTRMSDDVKIFFKKIAIGLICVPFIPLFFIYVLIRNCFTKKPISIDNFFKIKK